MSMIRYHQPWGVMEQMRREMDRMMGEENAASASDWVPAVDIKEDKERFIIIADIPGIAPKDIEVHAENGVLTIQGERESEKREEKQGYKRIERSYGNFFRRFTLPDSADTDKISAKGENGVLTITIPKRAEIQPRKIAVEG
ncbi:MAG: Hsp20/alpha crystallin family protein [Gammaproteobacteria bacterium]|nr:Hsp20/alpha crystallin family protein [Gammaproteobacteria bacterium]